MTWLGTSHSLSTLTHQHSCSSPLQSSETMYCKLVQGSEVWVLTLALDEISTIQGANHVACHSNKTAEREVFEANKLKTVQPALKFFSKKHDGRFSFWDPFPTN